MASLPEDRGSWDWWPLARLLTTGAVLGFAAHFFLGWTPDFQHLAKQPRGVFEVLSFFTLISFALAHLYVMLLMFPLYAVVTLNDALYDFSVWLLRPVFGGRRRWVLSAAGLAGEVLLFAAFAAAAWLIMGL